jgi:general secretion pathway protein G
MKWKKANNRAGFTLIELLAVIAIIAILAGIVLGIAGAATKKAALARVESSLKRMQMGLEDYKAEYGVFPQTDETDKLIDMIYTEPRDDGKRVFVEFLEGELSGIQSNEWIDTWGSSFRYDAIDPNRNNPDGYDLWSLGPDALEGTDDDLINW